MFIFSNGCLYLTANLLIRCLVRNVHSPLVAAYLKLKGISLLLRTTIHRHIEIWKRSNVCHLSIIGFSFVDEVACTILEKNCSFERSSKTTVPKYLKLDMTRSFHPFNLISLWIPFGQALFVISLVCSDLPFILLKVLSRL